MVPDQMYFPFFVRSWIIETEEKLLDEFDDVDPHEKLFMKVWNRHVRKYKIYADHNVSASFRNNRHRQCRIMLTRCDFFHGLLVCSTCPITRYQRLV